MVEGIAEGRVLLLKSISIVLFLIFAAWDITMEDNWLTLDFFFPLQVDWGTGKDINDTSSSFSSGNDLPWEEYSMFSSHLSWVILFSLYSQIYYGLMLFNVIPI